MRQASRITSSSALTYTSLTYDTTTLLVISAAWLGKDEASWNGGYREMTLPFISLSLSRASNGSVWKEIVREPSVLTDALNTQYITRSNNFRKKKKKGGGSLHVFYRFDIEKVTSAISVVWQSNISHTARFVSDTGVGSNLKGCKWQELGAYCLATSLLTCIPHRILLGWSNHGKYCMIGRACGTYRE